MAAAAGPGRAASRSRRRAARGCRRTARSRTPSAPPTSRAAPSIPTSSISSIMSSTANMPRIDGVPERKRRMPAARGVVGPIRNGSSAPIQPWIGWVSSSRWRVGDVQEGGRAGTAVEVLVGAADGQVDLPRVELDRQRPDRVAQVEQHQGAGVVGDLGDRRGVGDVRRPVGHVAERDQRGLRADHLGDLLRGHSPVGVDLDPAQGQPAARRRRPGRRTGRSGSCHGRRRSRCARGGRQRPPASACRAGPSSSRRPRSVLARRRAPPGRGRRPPSAAGRTTSRPSPGSAGRPSPGRRSRPGRARSSSAAGPASCRRSRRAGCRPHEALAVLGQRVGPVELLRVGHEPTVYERL